MRGENEKDEEEEERLGRIQVKRVILYCLHNKHVPMLKTREVAFNVLLLLAAIVFRVF